MINLFEAASNHPLFRQFKVSDILFTEYKCMEEEEVFGIWSQHNYFVYVLAGKKQWNTPRAEYMVHAGELIFVKKGANIIHKFFEEDFCALLVFMPDDYIRNVVSTQPEALAAVREEDSDSVFPLSMDPTLRAYFQSLRSYLYRKPAPAVSLLELKFRELLLNLITSPDHKDLRSYFKSLTYSVKPSIRAVMEDNFTYNLSLSEFAKLCGRSLTVFKRDFQEIYHCSPGRWLTRKRLEHARQLLSSTDRNISELILDCGFQNASHFTRVFKEKFGVTPVEYRG